MLRGIVAFLEKHHNVRIFDEAISAAVRLSNRYLAGRQLPDKAVSVLDTACARLSLGQNATPPAIEDVTRRIDDLAVQERILNRETAAGSDHRERLEQIAQERKETEAQLTALNERWEKTKGLVEKIRDLRSQLESAAAAETPAEPPIDVAALRTELSRLNGELDVLQGEEPLMRVCVDSQIVGEVISGWTGIPVGKMVRDEIAMVLDLESAQAAASSGNRTDCSTSANALPRREPAWTIPASRSAYSYWSAPAASAKRRRHWLYRTCCMAASETSLPLICPSSKRPTPYLL